MFIVVCVGAGSAFPEFFLRYAKKWLPGCNVWWTPKIRQVKRENKG
jgi:hypothetical protein